MRTIEEIAARMPNAKYFSVLDASSGFWQVQLDHESSKLCTFNTPFGRYMFKRLPFGISSAQDVFQSIMSDIFEDIEGVEVVVDDILVRGTNLEEHDSRLEQVLQRAQSRNLKLNKDKSQIRLKEISYIGHTLSEQGINPDPQKIQAITNMEAPTNREELQRILGMVTYLSKFIPHYSKISAPLRLLLEKNIEWHWTSDQTQALTKLKSLITSHPTLKFFDPSKPIKVSVDASSKGIGAVLLQDNQPVAYASKSLTPTQQNYAQIEKEMLAIVFGCQKFHDYLYGLFCVHIETDHKPLETILKKPLHTAPARLQRMILSIQRYPISVSYRPGKELLIADTLSRSPLPDTAGEYEFHEYNINTLHALPITESKLAEFKEQTKADPALQNLIKVAQTGWPDNKSNIPMETRPFWNYRDEITHNDGILFKGSKVIVPNSMQLSMLKLIHASHLGAEKCKRRARDTLFWPGMNAQIEDLVNSCTTCLTNKHSNTKEPLIPHSIPSRPWEKVGSDLFEFRGQHYLILVDYYSNFIEVDRLRQTTSEQVIETCKSQFSRHGIPNELISDNGPQFSSHKFHQFSIQYQFKHKTSSPYHPQSNGKAERAVQTIKSLLQRSVLEKRDFHLALLEFRNSPSNDILGSPSQRLMGRRTRTLLPTSENLLLPKTIPPSQVQSELKKHQNTQAHYYNKQATPLSSLQKGDKIMFQNGRTWLPATIAKATVYPRSYIIVTPEGQLYRRNRKHLRPIPIQNVLEPEPDSDDLDDYLTPQEGEPHQTTTNGTCEEQGGEPSPPQLRRSQRKTARPYSYADPYTLRF